MHMQAAPSQAELLHREFKDKKEKLKGVTLEDIAAKYGDAAAQDKLPEELLLGQTERQVEYDRAGRVIKGVVRKRGCWFDGQLRLNPKPKTLKPKP